MAIKTGKSFKVVEQSHDGDGCGKVRASFSVAKYGDAAERMANEEANRLAREEAPTRFYTMATTRGVYAPTSGLVSTSL